MTNNPTKKTSKPMWIRWKYVDHGAGGYKELELPAGWREEHGTPEDYLCAHDLVPHWSERFLMGRIKWYRISRPRVATLRAAIVAAEDKASSWKREASRLKEQLLAIAPKEWEQVVGGGGSMYFEKK